MEYDTKNKIVLNGPMPECPCCKRPTAKIESASSVTCVYYPPVYNEKGVNINPNKHMFLNPWECLECGKNYTVISNGTIGNGNVGYYLI